MFSFLRPSKGQSLIEVLLTVAIFAIFGSAVALLSIDGIKGSRGGEEDAKAIFYAQEGVDAVRSIRDSQWSNLSNGNHGLTKTGGSWAFSGTSEAVDSTFTRVVAIADVLRNGSGDIVTSGGTLDTRTKLATITINWNNTFLLPRSITMSTYLVDWNVYDWKQTTDTDFNAGTKTQTAVSGTGTAASVQLATGGAAKSWVMNGGTTVTHTADTDWTPLTFNSPFTDNSQALFNAGTYTSNTQYDVPNAWVELTAAGQTAGTGTFTSRVYDSTGFGSWTSMNWLTSRPTGKPLPNNKAVESGFTSGNVDMTSNTIMYHFDENAGATTFNDGSSNNYDATCSACPTTGVTGKFNNAATFNGSTSYITAPLDLGTWLGNTASLSFWIKTTQVGNATSWSAPGVTGVEQVSTGNDIFWGWIDNTGRIGVMAGNTAGAKSTNPINDNIWHHIGLTRNAANGQVKVYVDGVLQQTATSETGAKTTPFTSFGRIEDTGGTPEYLNGTLDEVAIFNNIIFTDTQALDLYLRGALRLKLQVRSCDDAACSGETFWGPDGTAATFYSSAGDSSAGPTSVSLTNVANNRYMQYRATLETDRTTASPELKNITISGVGVSQAIFSGTEVLGSGSTASIVETSNIAWNLITQGQSVTHTSDANFATGAFTNTSISGISSAASVKLSTDYRWYAPTTPVSQALQTVKMISSTDGWAMGNSGTIVRWNGTSWATVVSPITDNIMGVDCLSSTDCWGVGNAGKIIRWTGSLWSSFVDTGSQAFESVFMRTTSDAWAGANSGQIYRWNGTTWTQNVDLGNHVIRGIYCVSASDCWGAANSGRIIRWNGSSWSDFVDTGGEQWNSVFMISSTDGWIVSDAGNIRRWNGSAWNVVTSNTGSNLESVSCTGASDCWAVGAAGTIQRWNGSVWGAFTSPTSTALNAIFMTSTTSGAAVGNTGIILNFGLAYQSSGTFTNIIDATTSVTWGTVSWDRTLPTNTTLTIATRTGNVAVPDGTWSAWSSESTTNGGQAISSPAGRYIQYRGTFATTDPFASGSLDAISLSYSQTLQTMNAIRILSATDGWAVGTSGAIARYNGTTWNAVTSPTTQMLTGVDCVTASDCWAVADAGQIIRWNGTTWSNFVDTGTQDFRGIDMLTASNGWAVANSGQIYRWNGTNWTQTIDLGSHVFRGVSCVTASDCWAVADSGRIARWNGSSWSQFVDTGAENFFAISMVSGSDGWIVGNNGSMYRWNGTSWASVVSGTPNDLNAVHCLSASDCWAAGNAGNILHWNGSAWSLATSPTSNQLNDIFTVSATDAWAVGTSGTLLRYVLSYQSSATYTSAPIDAGSSVTWNEVFWSETLPYSTNITIATRTGNVATPDGTWTAWSTELTDQGGSTIVSAAGRYLQYRATFTSGGLATASLDDISFIYGKVTSQNLYGVNGTDTTHVWTVGASGVIYFYNGTTWASQASTVTRDLKSVSVFNNTNGFAVGDQGTIVRWNGTTWATSTSPVATALNDVYMVSTSFAVAVGAGGRIIHWNGSTWSSVTSPTTNELTSVSMISATDGWAVGVGGIILRWNGTTWASFSSPVSSDLRGMHMLTTSLGWAVGNAGVIVRWNGTAWATQTSPVTTQLFAVEARSSSEVWAVGSLGTILSYNGSTWSTFFSPSSRNLFDVTVKAPTDGWIVGATGTIIKDPFVNNGTFLSSILDADTVTATLMMVYWNATIPANTTLTIAVRTGPTSSPDGSWTAFTSELSASSGTSLSLAANRYAQYRATLATTDTAVTPSLDDITITYKK